MHTLPLGSSIVQTQPQSPLLIWSCSWDWAFVRSNTQPVPPDNTVYHINDQNSYISVDNKN